MVLLGEALAKPTYTVIQTMAESGSAGICHRARHEVYNRDIVQKTVPLVGLDDAAPYSEPELLQRLRHKHLTEVWEAQWDPNPAWQALKAITFVMPWYEGGSVHGALADGHRFSVGEALGVACGVLDALHYLHVDEGLLHRDVKPGNVLLDGSRTHSYLADLGSAALMGADGDAQARGGTLLYRPPEARDGRYAAAGEIYSTGLLLVECLNGPLPYADLDLDLDLVEARLAAGRRPVPDRMLVPSPHVSPNVTRLVNRMTAVDPARRPATALLAQRALQDAVHLDWRPGQDGPARVWHGRWPPAGKPAQGRRYEIRAEPVTVGRYAGLFSLTARWRREGTADWRSFASLARRSAAGDTKALAAFFRDVEAEAHRSAAA